MHRFSQAGLTCFPTLNFHSTPFLVENNVDDPIRIAAGADTFFQVPYDGVVPRYTRGDSTLNPLHPKVQQQTFEMIEAIVARSEGHSAYGGIQLCFWPYRQIPFCFLDIRHGYGDATIRQFEQDTGIRLPVPAADPGRFYRRYRFLLENHRTEWIDWRCRKIAENVERAAAIARRRNPDARILVSLLQEAWPNEISLYRKLLAGRSTSEAEWRERGVDLDLLSRIPGVQIKRQTRDAHRRYLHSKAAKSSRDNASSWELTEPFRKIPPGPIPSTTTTSTAGTLCPYPTAGGATNGRPARPTAAGATTSSVRPGRCSCKTPSRSPAAPAPSKRKPVSGSTASSPVPTARSRRGPSPSGTRLPPSPPPCASTRARRGTTSTPSTPCTVRSNSTSGCRHRGR